MRPRRFLLAASLAAAFLGAAVPGALTAPAQAEVGTSTQVAAGKPGAGLMAAGGSQRVGLAAIHLLAGAVRGPGGRALSRVCVTAAGPGGASFAISSADGRYELSVAHAGAYAIQYRDCQSTGHYLAMRTVRISAGPFTALPPVTLQSATAAQARQAALAAVGVTVPRHNKTRSSGSLVGHAAQGEPSGTVKGKVTSPSGHPLAGICVDLTTVWGGVGSSTAKNGTYRVMAPSGYSYRASSGYGRARRFPVSTRSCVRKDK